MLRTVTVLALLVLLGIGGVGATYAFDSSPEVAEAAAPVATPTPKKANVAKCFGRTVTIKGTGGPDVIRGTHGDDVIMGFGGKDKIFAGGGNDIICGGSGWDQIWGGDGHDLITGGPGFDLINGKAGNDTGKDKIAWCASIENRNPCAPPPPPPPPPPPLHEQWPWKQLAQCESGGNWAINTGNGYYGGLQFSLRSWQAVGGTSYPHHHSPAEQIYRAQKLQAIQGWGAWPACSIKIGLR